jgi:hypothetical protein
MFQIRLPLTLSTRITTHGKERGKEGCEGSVDKSEGRRKKEDEVAGWAREEGILGKE